MKQCQMRLWGLTKKEIVGRIFNGSLFVVAIVGLLWGPGVIAHWFMK